MLLKEREEQQRSKQLEMDNQTAQQFLKQREVNYRRMLIQKKKEESTQWEDFEDDTSKQKQRNPKQKANKLKHDVTDTTDLFSDDEGTSSSELDDEDDSDDEDECSDCALLQGLSSFVLFCTFKSSLFTAAGPSPFQARNLAKNETDTTSLIFMMTIKLYRNIV
uniref:Uncharacterized protein n=1 Tax=Glossina brevipalpis TaxID=37001 RepID=A0A1A9W0R4_9MUSC